MKIQRGFGYLKMLLLAFLPALLPETWGLEIREITGPRVVVNGSMPLEPLVLDCDYMLNESDKKTLVVKWYFNRQPYPVYQWIPNNKPQDLGILKGRLDLDYSVRPEEHNKHRALAILNPTSELSGRYTCWVSSFENEDVEDMELTVYSPTSDMSLTYSKPREESVVVSCRASGLFPAPDMYIFRTSSSVRRSVMEDARMERLLTADGYYNISIDLEMFDYQLEPETLFECVLSIPKASYEIHEEIMYFPVSGGRRVCEASLAVLSSLLFLVLLRPLPLH